MRRMIASALALACLAAALGTTDSFAAEKLRLFAPAKRATGQIFLPGTLSPGSGSGTTVVYATTSFTCGSKTYEISTGNNQGQCSAHYDDAGHQWGATCTDGQGNFSHASCHNGCNTTTGGGSCTIKQ